ncbi:MAG: hypothetical protein ABIQ88_00480 [Chitinophagaceae bacterium]
MKRIIPCVLAIAALVSTLSVTAQTAEEIVGKYVDAIGGKDVLNQVKSVYLESSVQIMGNDAPAVTTILNGKAFKTEMDFNGQKMIQCFTDKGGWAVNPMSGGNAEAMPDEIYKQGKEQYEVGGPLFDYAAKGNKIELLGKDGNNFKLKVTSKDNSVSTYLIDASTYYISKIVKKGNMMGQEVEVTISFTDYKKTEAGYVIPYTINTDLGQFALTSAIKKVEINKAVDPAIFMMPK